MDTQLLNEVISCLPKGKTHYRYFKGAYASRILSMLLPEQTSIHQLKKTRFKHLLEHPTVKTVIANCGDGVLTSTQLESIWHEPSEPFLLTVSRWGRKSNQYWNQHWYQTSRPGENLVLQLNLPTEHRQRFLDQVTNDNTWTINGTASSHPVQQSTECAAFRDTLAWARIDLDLETNEALIEEIQSDGIRNVKRWAKWYRRKNTKANRRALVFVEWFERFNTLWAETVLMAAIEFIHHELGIERIFIHTSRCGWKVKGMGSYKMPPKSLYDALPKKFAFKQTWAAPEFLLATKCYQRLIRQQPDIDFYQLSLNELRTDSNPAIKKTGGMTCRVV